MAESHTSENESIEALKADLSTESLQKEAVREAEEKWQNRDTKLDVERLVAPEMQIRKLCKIRSDIDYEYAIFTLTYKIKQEIEEKGLPFALKVYHRTDFSKYNLLFEYVAAYISDKLTPVLKEINDKLEINGKAYSHVGLTISRKYQTIALVIYDPKGYYTYYSNNPINQNYLDKNKAPEAKFLDLSIDYNALKFTRTFKPLYNLQKKVKQKKQEQDTLRIKKEELYDDLYHQAFDSPLATFQSIFMKKKFNARLNKLKNNSEQYKQIVEKYHIYDKEIDEITKDLNEYAQKSSLYEAVKKDAEIINTQLLPYVLINHDLDKEKEEQ